jgi:hypothetical protein
MSGWKQNSNVSTIVIEKKVTFVIYCGKMVQGGYVMHTLFRYLFVLFLFSIISVLWWINMAQARPGGLPECIDELSQAQDDLVACEADLTQAQNDLAACEAELFKKVFVTSEIFTANLGGISGADDKCNDAAAAAGLPGTYKAWISDSSTSPSISFTRFTQPYVLVDASNTRIADNWTDLTTCDEGSDQCLDNPINVDENGTVLSDPVDSNRPVWTNTLTDGAVDETDTDLNCNNFNSGVGSLALAGDYASTIFRWTERFLSLSCGLEARLYCFEQ